MTLPSANTLGMVYFFSEVGLGIVKRSRGASKPAGDNSLRMLWIVIIGSVSLSIAAAAAYPGASAASLARAYPVGVVLFSAGLLLRWLSIFYLGRFFTVDVAIAADHQVVDSGPYRCLRHPSYTGALTAFLGFGICLGNWLSILILMLPITLALLRRIAIEEAALRAGLGARYAAYARRTKRLIPFLY